MRIAVVLAALLAAPAHAAGTLALVDVTAADSPRMLDNHRDRIGEGLREGLAEAGVDVSDDAALRVRAHVVDGDCDQVVSWSACEVVVAWTVAGDEQVLLYSRGVVEREVFDARELLFHASALAGQHAVEAGLVDRVGDPDGVAALGEPAMVVLPPRPWASGGPLFGLEALGQGLIAAGIIVLSGGIVTTVGGLSVDEPVATRVGLGVMAGGAVLTGGGMGLRYARHKSAKQRILAYPFTVAGSPVRPATHGLAVAGRF